MNAILLAAGFGTRLRPITIKKPKCLVEINKVPLLKIWIEKLEKAGVKSILINTHYLSDQVKNFIYNNNFKLKIKVTYERKLLGTAGTLYKNLNFFEGKDGIFLHADNFCEESISNLIKKHNNRPKSCLITALTFRTTNPSSCGIFKINLNKVVKDFNEKPKNKNFGNLANAATYILSNNFIKIFKKKFLKSKDFSQDVIPTMVNKIYTFETKKKFIDIGTLKNYKLANSYAKR